MKTTWIVLRASDTKCTSDVKSNFLAIDVLKKSMTGCARSPFSGTKAKLKLSMWRQSEWLEVISQLTKSSCCRLRNVSKMEGLMSQRDLDKLVHAFIFRSLVVFLHACNCCSSPHKTGEWIISVQLFDFYTVFLPIKELATKWRC